MTDTNDDAAWANPDRAVQYEDDSPEALAGEPVEFDPDADDDAPTATETAWFGPADHPGRGGLPLGDDGKAA